MGNFYKIIRRQLNLLVDENLNPLGGKWSFDEENRQKIPKGLLIPSQFKTKKSVYINKIKLKLKTIFNEHPGELTDVWMPLTRDEALKSLDSFLQNKF